MPAAHAVTGDLLSRFWYRPTRSLSKVDDVLSAVACESALVFWLQLPDDELASLSQRVPVSRTPWGPVAVMDTLPRQPGGGDDRAAPEGVPDAVTQTDSRIEGRPVTMLVDAGLRLRPAVLPDDVRVALPWYQDPEVLYYSEGVGVAPYDFAGILGMYEYLAGIGELYIIETAGPDGWLPIGDVTLAPHTLPIVIGDPAYRSRGLGKRVLALLVGRAQALGWDRLAVKNIYTYNMRSRRLFESAGFSHHPDVGQ